MAMLKITDLNVSYGHVQALKDVNIEAEEGEIFSIIGSNGAGKTSLLRCISGLVKPISGTIEFLGKKLPNKPHEVVKAGIVHVPEGRKTFSGMTVRDNLLVGGYLHQKRDLEKDMERQQEMFPILRERKDQFAGTLSGGEQQMLAISRGLMGQPRMMLLDEPSLGLAPIVVNQIFDMIRQICQSGVTIILVEQNARKALSFCSNACILENGAVTIRGSGKELLDSDVVKKAYLGA